MILITRKAINGHLIPIGSMDANAGAKDVEARCRKEALANGVGPVQAYRLLGTAKELNVTEWTKA